MTHSFAAVRKFPRDARIRLSDQSQCYVRLPFPDLAGRPVRLEDLMSPARYDREGSDLVSRGLYLDLPAWGYHVFRINAGEKTCVEVR
jgi:hypothetical protein